MEGAETEPDDDQGAGFEAARPSADLRTRGPTEGRNLAALESAA